MAAPPDVRSERDAPTVPRRLADAELARRIQYTLFQVGAGRQDIERHCQECVEYGFGAAMVPGRWVELAARLLSGASTRVASAVDFPLGLMSVHGRLAEAAALVDAGADELDLAVPVGLLVEGDDVGFREAIASVVRVIAPVPVKVMLELPLLAPAERDRAVDVAIEAGAAWLKNASGGSVGIATPEDISYLRGRAPANVKVKASGGISTYEQAVALVEAGADAVGTSAGVSIVTRSEPLRSRDAIPY